MQSQLIQHLFMHRSFTRLVYTCKYSN